MKPTCPFKTAGFDHPDTCDKSCAWLVEIDCAGERLMCAVALIAQGVSDLGWMPANYWNEVGE